MRDSMKSALKVSDVDADKLRKDTDQKSAFGDSNNILSQAEIPALMWFKLYI